MRNKFAIFVLTGVLTGIASIATNAVGTKPGPTSWSCAVTFADRPGDLIRSDGHGTYVNGVDQVTCEIYAPGTGALQQNLHLQPQSKSSRRLHLEGQAYGGLQYASADVLQPDYFEVGQLGSAVTVGAPNLRPFRVTKDGATSVFRGDSFAVGTQYDSTSSVFVTPLTACSWNVEFRPDAPLVSSDAEGRVEPATTFTNPRLLALITGIGSVRSSPVLVGYAPMPFMARVDVVGNKPGCPVP